MTAGVFASLLASRFFPSCVEGKLHKLFGRAQLILYFPRVGREITVVATSSSALTDLPTPGQNSNNSQPTPFGLHRAPRWSACVVPPADIDHLLQQQQPSSGAPFSLVSRGLALWHHVVDAGVGADDARRVVPLRERRIQEVRTPLLFSVFLFGN